jgi:small subunit ribosomal protein S11
MSLIDNKVTKPFGFYFGPLADNRVAAFHINGKRKNLFFTLTDLTGAVLGSSSAGTFVSSRRKRRSVQVVELIVRRLSAVAKVYRIENVRLFFKLPTRFFALTVVRTLKSYGIRVSLAVDLVPVAHNGCRKKKNS